MINNAGMAVSSTSDSVSVASIERGVAPDMYTYSDCSNAGSVFAYPICGYINLLYNQEQMRTTCEAKEQAYAFLTWFLSSVTVQQLQTTLSILPAIVCATSECTPITMQCGTGTAITAPVVDVGEFEGSDVLGDFQTQVFPFYTTVDDTRTYTFAESDQLEAVNMVLLDEIDVAIIQPDMFQYLYPDDWNEFLASGELTILPLAVVGMVPAFNLPADIVSLDANVSATANFSCPLYGCPPTELSVTRDGADPVYTGLALSGIAVSKIMMGAITQWNDPDVLEWNDWLAERYTYAEAHGISINSNITLLLCNATDSPALQIFALGNYVRFPMLVELGMYTQEEIDEAFWPLWGELPFVWDIPTIQSRNPNIRILTAETQLSEAITLQPGGMSYYISSTGNSPYETEVRLAREIDTAGTGNLTLTITLGTVEDKAACLSNQSSTLPINNYSLDMTSITQPAWCWPYSSLVSFAVPAYYDTSLGFDTLTANETLNMLLWMLNDSTIDAAASAVGLVKIGQYSTWQPAVLHALEYITCDGLNCLITLPTYWSLSGSISAFGYALASIGIVTCITIMMLIVRFRRRVVIRSASTTFLLLMCFGLLLLFLCALVIVQAPPTPGSCSAFAWLLDLGLELTFVPLFLKMYRIYKIFNRKQLKVVKIGDRKLLTYGSMFLLFDCIVMAAWQGISPLQPITANVWDGVHDSQYLQCGITSEGQALVLVVGIEKAALLLFGCVMSFSTRKVTGTFNESSTVAWSIYNVILATCIIIPIIAFTDAIGDLLVTMELIFIMWVAVSMLILVFGTKMYTLAQGEQTEALSQLESQRTFTGGFSFVSVEALSKATIDQYMKALESHMQAVRSKQNRLTGKESTVQGSPYNTPPSNKHYDTAIASPRQAFSVKHPPVTAVPSKSASYRVVSSNVSPKPRFLPNPASGELSSPKSGDDRVITPPDLHHSSQRRGLGTYFSADTATIPELPLTATISADEAPSMHARVSSEGSMG
jgi:hypothetical protein